MGSGVAGQIARALTAAVLLSLGCQSPAHAQDSQPQAAPQPAPPPQSPELFKLSGSCSAPDAAVTSLAPLPNLADILRQGDYPPGIDRKRIFGDRRVNVHPRPEILGGKVDILQHYLPLVASGRRLAES